MSPFPVRVDFFATRDDLVAGLEIVESTFELKYVLEGMFESPSPSLYNSAFMVDDLGIAQFVDRNHEKSYLVIDAKADVCVRTVPQANGAIRYCVDLKGNPTGCTFRPGGRYKEQCIIDGYIGTATGNPDSINLSRFLAREVCRGFKKVQSYYVGAEALRLLGEGVRLTPSFRSSSEFDLRL
jgi:hypothetical protein